MWGGKRKGSGRPESGKKNAKKESDKKSQSGSQSTFDWTNYRKEKKLKDLAKLSQSSQKITDLFNVKTKSVPVTPDVIGDYNRNIPHNLQQHSVSFPISLPFYTNGTFSSCDGEDNFTCAPDTVYSIIESVLLYNGMNIWGEEADRNDEIVNLASKMLNHRLANNFECSSELRTPFWDKLCDKFPHSFCPKGTVRATVDDVMNHLSVKDPVEVVFSAKCLQCNCNLGWINYQFEAFITITTSNLKTTSDDLLELLPGVISRHAKLLIGRSRFLVSSVLSQTDPF